jgi:ribosomal protein S18 acetylase RimI-like enzyme
MSGIEFRKKNINDAQKVSEIIRERWYGEFIVVHNTIYLPVNLDGFIALEKDEIIGLITYTYDYYDCEIVSLDSLKEGCGIGTKLVELVMAEASANNCSSLWLITTNDNEKASAFYRKRGFSLVETIPGAINNSRKIKPEIPLTGENGTPITDELKFSVAL